MPWLGRIFFDRRRARKRVLVSLISTAMLLGVLPAWPQSEGPDAPARDNVLETSSMREYFSRWVRPTVAEAAPRTVYRQHRIRTVKARRPVEAATPLPVPRPVVPTWPNAQDSAGTGKIIPVELKTVRELAEPADETPLVRENELSDLDLAAQPPEAQPVVTQPLEAQAMQAQAAAIGTDGRASDDDADFQGNRFAAFAENVKAMGHASWLEPLLLALAGAAAAVAAMRIFAS
jgi:hypothetical protein